MAQLRGLLLVPGHQAMINGRLLAICGVPDPIGDAVTTLAGLGLVDLIRPKDVVVSGQDGTVGTKSVFCVQGARLATPADGPLVESFAIAAAVKKSAVKKTGAKKAMAKKAVAKTSAAKKAAGKKAAAKKAAAKTASTKNAGAKKRTARTAKKR